jgi:hypothetical protein
MPPSNFCGQPAAFIVRDLEGLESWTCEAHTERPRWIVRTPFAAWFAARGLPAPAPESHRCPEDLDEGPVGWTILNAVRDLVAERCPADEAAVWAVRDLAAAAARSILVAADADPAAAESIITATAASLAADMPSGAAESWDRFVQAISAAADEAEAATPNPNENFQRARLNLIAAIRAAAAGPPWT